MAFPSQRDMEIAILEEIEKAGGEVRRADVAFYQRVASHFTQLTSQDLSRQLKRGENAWKINVEFVFRRLVKDEDKCELAIPSRGILAITDKGRQRLRSKGLLEGRPKPVEVEAIEATGEGVTPPIKRHEELKQKMVDIGNKLRYNTSTEERVGFYQHDVLWKRGYKKDPSHVIEICAGGSLPKDFDALRWANEELRARGILVAVDEADYRKAIQRFENQPDIVVVKAETVDRLCELIITDLEFLKSIFSEQR